MWSKWDASGQVLTEMQTRVDSVKKKQEPWDGKTLTLLPPILLPR